MLGTDLGAAWGAAETAASASESRPSIVESDTAARIGDPEASGEGAVQDAASSSVDAASKQFSVFFVLGVLWESAIDQLGADRAFIHGRPNMLNDDLSLTRRTLADYLGDDPRVPFLGKLQSCLYVHLVRAYLQSLPRSRTHPSEPMRGEFDAVTKFATIDSGDMRNVLIVTKNGADNPILCGQLLSPRRPLAHVRAVFDFKDGRAEDRFFLLKLVPDGIAHISAKGFFLNVELAGDDDDDDNNPRFRALVLTDRDGFGRHRGFNLTGESQDNPAATAAYSMLHAAIRDAIDKQQAQGGDFGWSDDTRASLFLPMETDEQAIDRTISFVSAMQAQLPSDGADADETSDLYGMIYKIVGQMLASLEPTSAKQSPRPPRHFAAPEKKGKAAGRKHAAEKKSSETSASSAEAGAVGRSASKPDVRSVAAAALLDVQGDAPREPAEASELAGPAEAPEPAVVEEEVEVYDLEPWRKFVRRPQDACRGAAAAAAHGPTVDEEAALIVAQLDLPIDGTRMKAPQILAAKNRLKRILKVRQIAQGKSDASNPNITVNRAGSHITWHVAGVKPFTTAELHGRGDAELPTKIVKTLLLEMARFLQQSEATAPDRQLRGSTEPASKAPSRQSP